MIQSRADLDACLEADRRSLGIKRTRPALLGDEIWRFQIALRKYEYRLNVRGGAFTRLACRWARARYHFWSVLLGFSIPPNVFGAGLSIAHRGTIVVHDRARVGRNCRIHVCTNIGTAAGADSDVPSIGDNVYIGPGAKIFGRITLADGIAVGANAVVNRSFNEPNITIAGVPAREISRKGSEGLLVKGAGPS